MRMITRLLLASAWMFVATAPAQARGLQLQQLSMQQQAQVRELVDTEIRADLNQNAYARLYEAAAASNEPPMSPETRAVMARGAYLLVSGYLTTLGIRISEYEFTHRVQKVLDKVASMGLYPHAFTVGNIGRLQLGAGGAAGVEFNFYVEKGDLKLSSYAIVGLQFGAAATASDQYYAALCYGNCTGGGPSGTYVGADFSSDFGLGFDVYFEFGLDFTDMLVSWLHGKKYTLKDLYNTRVVYVGIGFDVGGGGGLSVNTQVYTEMFETTLAHLGGSQTFDPRLLTRYDLKKYR